MRVADYMGKTLAELGISKAFMLSGTGSIYLDDAFAHQENIDFICARHEAAAVAMAIAASKLDGTLGVVIATTGPGGGNAIGGVIEAWVDSVPILVISGQVQTGQIDPEARSFGVQGFNIIENVQHITKYAAQLTEPNDIKLEIDKAIYHAFEGRPGPVWLDVPLDIQSAEISESELVEFHPPEPAAAAVPGDIDNVVERLRASARPVVVFGQGIRTADAIDEFLAFLTDTDIPAISARMALDIVPYAHPNYMGLCGIRGQLAPINILREADLIISLAASMPVTFASEKYELVKGGADLIMVNIDKTETDKRHLEPNTVLNMDVKTFLGEISARGNLRPTVSGSSDWLTHCQAFKAKNKSYDQVDKNDKINSYYFIEELSALSDARHIFVNDAGSGNYICSQSLELKEGQREITSGAFYSMGVALPMAIGAGFSHPDSQIIAVIGDGSIELNIQELRTLSLNRLNVKIFVINNGGYASIRKSQDDFVGGRYTDDQEVLDFKTIAHAFDLNYRLIENYQVLDSGLADVFLNDEPELIEVICDPDQQVHEPFVTALHP
jgi:acetolactate synthase I/II/III large subunit